MGSNFPLEAIPEKHVCSDVTGEYCIDGNIYESCDDQWCDEPCERVGVCDCPCHENPLKEDDNV